jgi:hypothetical protein
MITRKMTTMVNKMKENNSSFVVIAAVVCAADCKSLYENLNSCWME